MRRLLRLSILGMLALLAPADSSTVRAQEERTAEAVAPAKPDEKALSPIHIFLSGPNDLGALWKSIQRPDFILMSGEELQKRLDRARAEGAELREARPFVTRSVAVRGKTAGELASLSVGLKIETVAAGATWVPIRLDGQTITQVRDGDREILPRVAPGGSWEIALQGAGEHPVTVELKVLLRSTADGHRMGFAIPEAPATSLELGVDQDVRDATAGADEPLERTPVGSGVGTTLSGHLSPRSRLEVSWRVEKETGAQLSPLLSIQGEIAIDVDPGSFRTRASWAIKSVRGASRSLELRLDPADEVLELTLDGQSVPAGIERIDGATRLAIPLSEPLRPGPTRRLIMTTRRALAPQTSTRLTFNGFPLVNAKEQSGAIGIATSGNLWITGVAGRGLLQIDPRTELPSDLRARPATLLAYKFVDQPFDLGLRVDPSPPVVRTDARTTISLDASQARIDTRLEYRTAHGRLFELNVALPRGLELESIGPPEIVESWHMTPESEGLRLMTARLTVRAQESAMFSVHLQGRQSIDASRPVRVSLFQPRESTSGGGRTAILAGRDLTVERPEQPDGAAGRDEFRTANQEAPSDWIWPAGVVVDESSAIWLRHDGNPPALALQLTRHSRSVDDRTMLSVQVSRREVEVRQELERTVYFGVLDHLDIEVPRILESHWGIEEGDIASRSDLGTSPSGDRRVRLRFAEEVTDQVRVTFVIRLPFAAALSPEHATDLLIPRIKVLDGATGSVRARVASEPGVRLELQGQGWVGVDEGDTSNSREPGLPLRFTITAPASPEVAPLRVIATAEPLATLPPTVVSRLWLRTVQEPSRDLRTMATFWVETHPSTFSIALPPGAEWIRARAGGDAIGQVEQLPKGAGYQFRFPARLSSGGLLVELEYMVPARYAGSTWKPPRLVNGGVVEHTLWEVRVPTARIVVGVPPGWTDENEWAWDRFYWARRPWMPARSLAAWVGASSAAAKGVAEPGEDGRGDYHRYVFGYPDAPPELRLRILPQAWVVGVCSGLPLALGLLIVYLRPPIRLVWTVLGVLVLAVATVFHPSETILGVQAATSGVLFALLVVVLQRFMEWRRPGRSTVFGDNNTITPGSSVSRFGVGSDDSTAIRVRPTSTVDHLATGLPGISDSTTRRAAPPER